MSAPFPHDDSQAPHTAEGLAAGMVAAMAPAVEDFIEQQTGAWQELVRAVERDLELPTIDRLVPGNVFDAFEESLSDGQAAQYHALEDAHTREVIIQRQAAFELGRQFERARSGGAR